MKPPKSKRPNVQTPDVQTPDVQTPDVETPDVETPDRQTPALHAAAADAKLAASPRERQKPAARRSRGASVPEPPDPMHRPMALDAASDTDAADMHGTDHGTARAHDADRGSAPDNTAATEGDGSTATPRPAAHAPTARLPAASGPPARVILEIDPNISAWFVSQRYDIEIRGWVVSSSPVESVTLSHNNAMVSQMQYGPPGPTARVALRDGTAVTRHVYTLSLPRPRAQATEPCTITLTARTINNQTFSETYLLTVDPLLPTSVRVESGPTRPSVGYGGELAPVVLFVERAALDASGSLQFIGWVISLSTLVAIQVFAGEERIAAPKLGLRRDDVASVFPSYPNATQAGFSLTTPLTGMSRRATTLRAQAITAEGFVYEIVVPLEMVARIAASPPTAAAPPAAPDSAFRAASQLQAPLYRLTAGFNLAPDVLTGAGMFGGSPAPGSAASRPVPAATPGSAPSVSAPHSDPRRAIKYFCDVASLTIDGEVVVNGWAVCAIGVAAVEVWLDDERLGEAELGLPRDDVGEEHRSIPMARYSGFRFDGHTPRLPDGRHRLRVVVRNGLDDFVEDLSIHVIDRPRAPSAFEAVPEFRFEIDRPSLVNDAIADPITGRLTIEGWVLSRSGVAEMQVWLDDQRLGDAQFGLARQDVGSAFPDWPNSLRSGYAFHCPPRSLRNGRHVVKITVRALSGEQMERSFRIDVRKPEGSDDAGTIRRHMSLVETDLLTEALGRLDYHPAFHLVVRHNEPIEMATLDRTLASIGNQAYHDWHLTILAEDSDNAEVARASVALQPEPIASRITVIDATAGDTQLDVPFGATEVQGGTSATVPGTMVVGTAGAPNDARHGETPRETPWEMAREMSEEAAANPVLAAAARPVLFGLLCPGDELGCDALFEIALANARSPATDFLYADEIRVSPTSREREPFCKPDFSPDLLLSTNYIGRPWFATPALLVRAEVTPRALLRDAEYDIVLRCTEQAAAIRHVPKWLCRRGSETLDSHSASRAALRRAATRRGVRAEVHETAIAGTFRFRRTKRATGKVSIIIPTCAAHGHIETCIRTLRQHTAYRDYEIVCVDNIPPELDDRKRWLRENADKVVDIPDEFNWSRFNNLAVDASDGEYLLFLNDDVEVIAPGWLDALLEHTQRPEVGIVGAQLLYPGGKVQHAGMFLATIGIARHAFRFATADEPGYFGLALTQRNVIAVTGACMLVRREVFDAVGRFDEAHEVVNNDLDFCLRAHRAGLLTVYTPYAQLIHHELASRDRMEDVFDTGHFARQWKTLFAAGDPYFSPLLSRHADDYRPDDEPVEGVYAGHPLFHRDDIKRILVVKLDHIGDFITALPGMRRLKQHFPKATIHVLAARGARAFAEAEPCIDGFIEFEFFHARSSLGQKDLTEDDYAELHARLLPYGFDLAIDLRKHADTREALRHIPARFHAGFDFMGQFTFLDIALEWEGDKNLHRKRSHVTDDLVNLVEAVGAAASEDRNHLTEPVWPAAMLPDFLDDAARAMFAKPVVAVHPGVGTVMRQWPAEHFAALVDLLTETDDVNAVLVGGPDEIELSQEVLDRIVHRDSVVSLTGKTSVAELIKLLACCALYVGNNSGPKHIAAAIGVPTIGVHSGVIDSTEWAPIGKHAMALRRNMTCSPCYLARQEDCPRNLACLRELEPASVWQACRTMLATSQVPVYFIAPPRTPEIEAPEVAGTATGKRRAGRKRAAATSAPPGAEPVLVVVAADEVQASEPHPAKTQTVDAQPIDAPPVNVQSVDIQPGEAPVEMPADEAHAAVSATGVDRQRGKRKRAAGRVAAPVPEARPAFVEAPAPANELLIDEQPADEQLIDELWIETPIEPALEFAAEEAIAAVKSPAAATPRAGRKRAAGRTVPVTPKAPAVLLAAAVQGEASIEAPADATEAHAEAAVEPPADAAAAQVDVQIEPPADEPEAHAEVLTETSVDAGVRATNRQK